MRLGRRGPRCESGQALVLALIFVTFAAVIIAATLGLATTNLAATSGLRTTRGSYYDADAAMEAAIATIRVDTNSGYLNLCPSFSPAFTLNTSSIPLRVDCFPVVAPLFQRRVVLSVCRASTAAPCPDASSLLRADVKFYDDQTFGRAVAVQTWSARQ
jgi:hypothetical protein